VPGTWRWSGAAGRSGGPAGIGDPFAAVLSQRAVRQYTQLTLPSASRRVPARNSHRGSAPVQDLRGPAASSARTEPGHGRTLGGANRCCCFSPPRFASFPVAPPAGGAALSHCDISLTLHQAANAYRCHYCGFSRRPQPPATPAAPPDQAPGDGHREGGGAVRALFPEARIARMDRDTTAASTRS